MPRPGTACRTTSPGDGLRALQRAGLLAVKVDYLPAPLSVIGWKEERAYTLQPPFGPRGRSRQTGKRQSAATTAAGGLGPAGKTAQGARVVKLRPRTGRAS